MKRHTIHLMLAVLAVACSLVATLFSTGCDDEGSPVSASTGGTTSTWFYPTIASLTVSGNTIKRADGGILTLSCQWMTATPIHLATGIVALASTVADPGPIGIVSSGTATASIRADLRGASFLEEFSRPIEIPTSVGSATTKGTWRVQLPFPVATVSSAPLGKHQMLLWMLIDGSRSNSLAFEIEFK
ncbi:MAG TPA: hypothetical protein VIV61_11365 [Candidatus Ozemobacteraceae bacterium]